MFADVKATELEDVDLGSALQRVEIGAGQLFHSL